MRRERVKLPMGVVFRQYPKQLVLGTMIALATFVLFYLMTVFALSWGTSALGFSREKFLVMQLFAILLVRGHTWQLPRQDLRMRWNRIPPEYKSGLVVRARKIQPVAVSR